MNTTTLELPRIATLATVQPLRPDLPSLRSSVCRDPVNREMVLLARGQGDSAPGCWEQWLFAPLIVASVVAMVTAATTAGQWLAQWPVFVRWVEHILR